MNQRGQLLVEKQKVIELDFDRPFARVAHAHAVYHAGCLDGEYPVAFLRETLAQLLLRQTFDRPSNDLASGRPEFANELCHFKSRFRLSSLSLTEALLPLSFESSLGAARFSLNKTGRLKAGLKTQWRPESDLLNHTGAIAIRIEDSVC